METSSLDEPPSSTLLADLLSGTPDYFLIASFIAIALLLLSSALISASEVAFFSLSADDLDRCRESEDKKDKNIVELLRNPQLLLATILIMNNFVNVAIVTLSTFMMWELASSRNPTEIIVGLVTFSVTFAITFFGEIIPKVYATQRNLFYSRLMGGVWHVLEKVCSPVSWMLLKMGNVVEKRFKKKGYSTTVEELNQALDLTTENDETTAEEKDILKGIVNFGTLTVKQIMKSRMDISAVDFDISFNQLMEQVNSSGFSRVPVYKESLDKIEGVLYIKDLLPFLDEDENFKWQKLIRPGFFVPETKKLDSLLKDFQNKRVHMAVVVDEYGGTSGLITLEDLIEEIIGDINDEFDEENVAFVKIDDNTFVFEGKTSLHDFCKAIDVDSSTFDAVKGESESLGGLILELNSAMPKVADQIVHDRFVFTVVSVDKKRIKRVRVLINQPPNQR
ncbi:MAG TPA: gliding motility-associated protein GldE [Cyclobacteriaceae bacterium]|nr:gliding motility-associated protein GldE [Cyclobacteriaceae bacterium]